MIEMNIKNICKIHCKKLDNTLQTYGKSNRNNLGLLYTVCSEVDEWEGTPIQEYLEPRIRENLAKKIESWDMRLNTSVKGRDYFYDPFFADKPYGRQNAKIHGLECSENDWDYIYVLKREEAYNKYQFVVALNNETACIILPARKGLQSLEVGHFYKIRVSDYINHGRWEEYKYEIIEIDEETYKYEGLITSDID